MPSLLDKLLCRLQWAKEKGLNHELIQLCIENEATKKICVACQVDVPNDRDETYVIRWRSIDLVLICLGHGKYLLYRISCLRHYRQDGSIAEVDNIDCSLESEDLPESLPPLELILKELDDLRVGSEEIAVDLKYKWKCNEI